jgi:sulfite oxidase
MAKQPEQLRLIRQELSELRRRASVRKRIATEYRHLADKERKDEATIRADEAIQRVKDAAKRSRAAMARRDARSSGDQDPDERDRLADLREQEADERERLADLREAAADERDRRADQRQRAADERDRDTNSRDRLADARDAAAHDRDQAALRDRTQLVELRHQATQVTSHYYRISSPQKMEEVIRGLGQEAHLSPTHVLGYASHNILRVDHPASRLPDAAIHDLDPMARRLPEPPPDPN